MIRNNIYKILILLLFLVLTWLMLFNYGHCASDQYYFPMQQNENSAFTEGNLQAIGNQFNSTDNYIIVYTYSFAYGQYYCYVLYFPKSSQSMIYGEINNDANAFSLYPINTQYMTLMKFSIVPSSSAITLYPTAGTNTGNYQNLPSSSYNSNYSYVSNFQLMTNSGETAKIVLFYDDGSIPDGDTAREDEEKPDKEDYFPDWTNQPNFDNSTVENALNSVFSIIGWLGDNIKDSIFGLGEFITDTVRWSIQKVLDRITDTANGLLSGIQSKINDVITTIGGKLDSVYNKFSDFYDGFVDFADLFIHPFDEEEYEEQIENCVLITQYEELMDNCETLQDIFDYAAERDHFSLYIDFENPFADSQHKIIHSQISFDWLVPLRSVYRPFLWVFTLIELFTGSMRLLGNIIGGKAK